MSNPIIQYRRKARITGDDLFPALGRGIAVENGFDGSGKKPLEVRKIVKEAVGLGLAVLGFDVGLGQNQLQFGLDLG
jgi:hypothetical protein